MADRFSKKKRSEIMSKNKSVSGIERVPKRLQSLNLRAHPKGVYGNPDFANKKRKIALFIDGCFWHFHKTHVRMPKSNKKFWTNKFKRNKERDKEVGKYLRSRGWVVIRIWECELKRMK